MQKYSYKEKKYLFEKNKKFYIRFFSFPATHVIPVKTFCDKRVKYVLRQNLSILTSFFFAKKDARSLFEGKTWRILAREKNNIFPSQPVILVYSATRANYIAHYANRVRLAYVSRHF